MLRVRKVAGLVGKTPSRAVFSVTCRYNSSQATTPEKSYSETLLLPKTDFPPRRKPAALEELLTQSRDQLYSWNAANKSREPFVLHDGPPYANGALHVGHVLNKVTKDIINRYQLISGKRVDYVPGWDCHGLPIELKALETLSKKLKTDAATVLPAHTIREMARKHATDTIESQRNEFRGLGIMGDWENPYLTMSHEFEVAQLRIFQELLTRGRMYRKIKPVYWGWETRTALAEAELEYNPKHKSQAVFVAFPLNDKSATLTELTKDFSDLAIVIWTTTPWTLVANRACSVHKDVEYALVCQTSSGRHLLVGKKLVESLSEKLGELEIVKDGILGSDLTSSTYTNPLTSTHHPIYHADYVSDESGTGMVHSAPGHGQDDYLFCMSHGIAPYSPVNASGHYTSDLPEKLADLAGKHVLGEGQKAVIALATENKMLLQKETYTHSYPYDWRSKKPIIIRSTPQWFANVDDIKEDTIKALDQVEFVPKIGEKRLKAFVNGRTEWCISRQRSWGVPIPIVYSKESGAPLEDVETVSYVIDRIAELGTDAWFDQNVGVEQFLPAKFNADDYVRGTETMDVWFDSGSSWKSTLEARGIKQADVYFEGSDQHRGWFQSSLLTKISTSAEDVPTAPYKSVITHGFLLDEKGNKMSKSLGNVMLPTTIINGGKGLPALGVDGIRLWVAQSDFTNDVAIGPVILKHVGEFTRKLRTTFRFLLGNLGYGKQTDMSYSDLHLVDRIALQDLHQLEVSCKDYYSKHQFNRVYQQISHHMNTCLSSFYFDIAKERLYVNDLSSQSRQSVAYVLSEVLKTYLAILSPLTPLMTQEVHNFSGFEGNSPYENGWHVTAPEWTSPELLKDTATVKAARSIVLQAMAQARTDKKIGTSLGCDISLTVDESSDVYKLLKKHEGELAELFITSGVSLNSDVPSEWSYSASGEVDGTVVKATAKTPAGCKCPRCWQFTAPAEDVLCTRCDEVVQE
ncbi:Isoleucine--tRNA ligase [Yarrowia sp. C11]|nr:Isoleucine--tRNA ligase [Yarrowia sp. E02]KAG5373437.1 Isoleucine--tRNA ligase [Yarrowia sp. C11]